MELTWEKKTVIFLTSQAITLLGSSIVQIAIIWYIAIATSSGIWVSILTLCSFIPQMLISPLAGVWADRYNRKKIIIYADAFIALTTFILIVFIQFSAVEHHLYAIAIVSAIRSLGSGMQYPAINAVIPQIVPEASLLKFNGMNSSMQSAIQFLSPMIAGLILYYGSLSEILMIDVITALLGITLLRVIKIAKLPSQSTFEKSKVVEEIKVGFSFIKQDRIIAKLFLNYGFYIFFSVPSGFLITLFVERTFQDSYLALSIVEIIGFAGMFLGGLIFTVSRKEKNVSKLFLQGILCYGLLSMTLGFTHEFLFFGCVMFCLSFCIPIIQSSFITYLQEHVKPDLQGRVFSMMQTIFSGIMPMGMLVFGPLSDFVSLHLLFIISGICMIVVVGIYMLSWKKGS